MENSNSKRSKIQVAEQELAKIERHGFSNALTVRGSAVERSNSNLTLWSRYLAHVSFKKPVWL